MNDSMTYEYEALITLPWRAFKAYHQLYCLETMDKNKLEGKTQVSLFKSLSPAAQVHIKLMEDQGIIITHYEHQQLMGVQRLTTSATYGYDDESTSVIVCPATGSSKGKAWLQSKGHCVYCGSVLTLFGKDALGKMPAPYSGYQWACKSCQTIKKDYSMEEFRMLLTMRRFEQKTGIRFSVEQLEYLSIAGVTQEDLMIEPYVFYFESTSSISQITA